MLIPPALLLVVIMILLGGGVAVQSSQVQPDGKSNDAVAKYFPDGWQFLLMAAADKAGGRAPDHAVPPWTVLGGIVATQTEFGRFSPYDSIDRDPGRRAADLPSGGSGGSGGGGDVTTVGATRGAGPGPVEGVSGSGDTGSVASGHAGPPPGDLGHQLGWFLFSLRMHESNGNYTAGKGTGRACGAYQYINSTWNNFEGYPTACDAPPSVQDRRAVRDILAKWQKYKKWQKVSADHFYPAWANMPEKWNRCPADCGFNPTVWGFVDDVMKRMRDVAQRHPATGPAGQPAAFPMKALGGGRSGDPVGDRGVTPVVLRAGFSRAGSKSRIGLGCPVDNPSPQIGGKGRQGSGPYLLNPAAADDMRSLLLDPQSPCDSSQYVAAKLVEAAKKVHADDSSPRWDTGGTESDLTEARKYWSKVVATAGIFVDRSADPDAPCAVPPPDNPRKPWSVAFRIISIWRCETARMPELHLVTGAEPERDGFTYSTETDRAAATETLVNEALSVSYGAGKWKTDNCDDRKDDRQGVFPMTKREAAAAGVADRCDVDKNIAGAAALVLRAEAVPPEKRPADLGGFQPMVGGWQNLGIAMGDDLKLFSTTGPGQRFSATGRCNEVMSRFLIELAPHAAGFARLTELPPTKDLFGRWAPMLDELVKRHNLSDPALDPGCVIGSWAPGYHASLAQTAAALADDGSPFTANLDGLGNYYQARENANEPGDAVPGKDTLVIPRLALRPLKEIGAPIAPDATEAWSRIGTTEGLATPLPQLAVEYAWFFGGVIAPFGSAGKLIGSLASATTGSVTPASSAGQTTIGPDGCPTKAPSNTLRQGAAEIGIQKLCADSVARARTPQAARAIKWALAHLGWDYSQPRRNEDGFADCSSFLSRAYRDSGAIPNLYRGNAPVTGTFRVVAWTHQIPLGQARPGDFVEPHPGHVAMQLADGYKVHTNMTGDVSKVERAYTSAYWVGWVDPNKV